MNTCYNKVVGCFKRLCCLLFLIDMIYSHNDECMVMLCLEVEEDIEFFCCMLRLSHFCIMMKVVGEHARDGKGKCRYEM